MQHTLVPMSMQQKHTSFELHDNFFECILAPLEGEIIWVWIEYCLAAFATCGGRGQVEEEGPGCAGWNGGRGGGRAEVNDV